MLRRRTSRSEFDRLAMPRTRNIAQRDDATFRRTMKAKHARRAKHLLLRIPHHPRPLQHVRVDLEEDAKMEFDDALGDLILLVCNGCVEGRDRLLPVHGLAHASPPRPRHPRQTYIQLMAQSLTGRMPSLQATTAFTGAVFAISVIGSVALNLRDFRSRRAVEARGL